MPAARWSLLSKASWIARSSHSVCVTPSGVANVYGGELKPRTPVDSAAEETPSTKGSKEAVKGSVHLFSLKARTQDFTNEGWKTLRPARAGSDVPEARVGATAVYAGDALWMWGGRGGVDMAPLERPQVGVWRGSLAGGADEDVVWERVSAVNEEEAPEARSYHSAVVHAGKMYVHAGCPVKGRLGSLHSFDIATSAWETLASGPEPVRGGTSLVAVSLEQGGGALFRYGGFSGYELPTEPGSLDIYSIADNQWSTVQPEPDSIHGAPGPRSVHGFVPFKSTLPTLADAVALLFHGERDASTLGHAGAGTFWDDVWLLAKRNEQWAWRKVDVIAGSSAQGATSSPEGRGWFASTAWVDEAGNSQVVVHGGLLGSNERSDELWELRIE